MKHLISPVNAFAKTFALTLAIASASVVSAVPAYRGWQTFTQPDGSSVTVRHMGDEFYSYWENEQGQQVQKDANGVWQVLGDAPAAHQVMARRLASPMHMSRTSVWSGGNTTNAQRGLVLLVNFKDKSFSATRANMDSLCNAVNYTYNGAVGSVKKYFTDQSNGLYTPVFDVVGPVTLSKNVAYYGAHKGDDNDAYAADMVVEACKLADGQVDFSKYATNGEVGFVYVIFAGQGEADGGGDNTIWPHSWNIYSAAYYGNCTYKYPSECKFDGVNVNSYACSGELSSYGRSGVGTLCHEFSHVIGMPDYYDVDYGSNYDDNMTPDKWTIMDQGSYNSKGNCPPNYSTYDKYYMGWLTPQNLGTTAKPVTLLPINHKNASGQYDAVGYQINSSGSLAAYSSTVTQYYVENRQQSVWDAGLPGHGMIIWKVMFNSSAWNDNKPNATAGTIRYGVVSASGGTKNIGKSTDPFPGTGKVTSWTGLTDRAIKSIVENTTAKTISFNYINDVYTISWYNQGTISFTYVESGKTLTLPAFTPQCEGKTFVGWTAQSFYVDPFNPPSDLFTKVGTKKVTSSVTYYAVFKE